MFAGAGCGAAVLGSEASELVSNMSGFAKLDSGIVNSTIWVQPHDVLRVWIWFLSQADSRGTVDTAAPALSLICMVPLERMREILLLLESPDPDSRSPNDDGRRIEKIDGGGWRIINYGKYRESRDPQERKEYQRNWDKQHRPSGHQRAAVRQKSDHSPTQSDHTRPETTKAEAERAEAEEKDQKKEKPQAAFELPSWIDRAAWDGYAEMRKRKRAPLTPRACTMVVRELDKLRSLGQEPADVLDQSTRNSWTDVYALKSQANGKHGGAVSKLAPSATDVDFLMQTGAK
jgi:hypothetical protein